MPTLYKVYEDPNDSFKHKNHEQTVSKKFIKIYKININKHLTVWHNNVKRLLPLQK